MLAHVNLHENTYDIVVCTATVSFLFGGGGIRSITISNNTVGSDSDNEY